ncbi:hypothetical protein Tco_0914615 [Tanacetum coccineum]
MEETFRITLNEICYALLLNEIPLKEKDPGSFTIQCIIGNVGINKALGELGANISLMPYSIFTRLGKNYQLMEADNDKADQYADSGMFSNQNDEEPTSKPTLFTANTKEPDKQILKLKELLLIWIQPQRRLNLKVQDVVKAEIVKLLDDGLIYAISDSPCVIPMYVVPKKRGMTIIANENNELIPTRIIIGWKVLGIFQISPLALKDQEKTTFTCPCEETNLILNWENCHFIVKEGIVLGHKISNSGIEVDKAKLLMKMLSSSFRHECIKAFNILIDTLLTMAPVLIAHGLILILKLMPDARDFVVGAY